MENLHTKDSYLDNKNIVVALSGGVDSVVLLNYLYSHFPNNLRVLHCCYNISKHSIQWSDFCKNLCSKLNIGYEVIKININNKTNIEEQARVKRYQVLALNLKKDEILCTAHHRNDQIETLLLQLLRGSGVAGLAAMPRKKLFAKGFLYRPFIDIDKNDIVSYAQEHNLAWVEDDTNNDISLRRNLLRIEIIPKLSEVYKNLTKTLARSSKHQAEALKLNKELALIDINKHNLIDNCNINVSRLKYFSHYRIKNIIRYHLNLLGFLLPSAKVTQQIINLLYARQDAQPLVCWGQYEVRRYRDYAYFIDTKKLRVNTCHFYTKFKNCKNFFITYKKNGQYIKLVGRQHRQSLKKILQEKGIVPWERDKLKMYYVAHKLVAIERIGDVE